MSTATKTEKTEKKAKKEKGFNSERTARLVKNALKEVFPKENFIVSSYVDRVEVMYENTACLITELNTFSAIFCIMGKIKKEQLQFTKITRAATTAPAK